MYREVTDLVSATKLPIPQDAWMLFQFPDLEVIQLHLAPGAAVDKHTNPWRIVFYVLKGKGTLNVEDGLHTLVSQQSIVVEAGKSRFWYNPGPETLELLVIKTNKEP